MASTITWNQSLSVGNAKIDQQHKELSKLAQKALQLEGLDNNSDGDFYSVLNDIAELSMEHFSLEEEMLAKNRCPTFIEHREAHKQCLEQLMDILDRASAHKQDIRAIVRFVTDNMTHHLLKMDIPNKEFMRDNQS